MAELDLSKLAQHYSQANTAEGKSPRTIDGYNYILDQFRRYLIGEKVPPSLASFTLDRARNFILHEQSRGLSPFSVQDLARGLKAFGSWLWREEFIAENTLARLKIPKAPQKVIEILTTPEIEQLINHQNPLTACGCRNIAILLTFIDSGIRLTELCETGIGDAHLDNGYVKVMGKGAKERLVPLGSAAQKAIWRYVIHFRPKPILDDRLFLANTGEPLSPDAVKHLMSDWGHGAGVPRLHAHLCRHTFATNFLVFSCGDVFRLQQILGHTTLEMVRRYVHLASLGTMVSSGLHSPVDQMRLQTLRGRKIDKILAKNQARGISPSQRSSVQSSFGANCPKLNLTSPYAALEIKKTKNR